MLLFSEPLRRFGIVAKTHQLVHVSDVNVVFAEHNAERPLHAAHKNFPLLRGPLPAEFVVNGAGSLGFWPCVTCDSAADGRRSVEAKSKMFRARMAVPF